MNWDCINTEERLSEYLEGQLAATERLELEAHLAACTKCSALVAQVGALVAQLGKVEPEAEPAWLVFKILKATSGTVEQKRESWWRRLLAGALAPRFALGLGSVAATLFILFQALGINPKRFSADDLNPINMFRAADRQAHLTYARGMRFVNDLRVVYEFRSRLQDQEASATSGEPRQEEPSRQPGTSSPQSERKLRNDLMVHHTTQIAAILPGIYAGGAR